MSRRKTMATAENKITITTDCKVLVRVCCSATCTKFMRVFGCKLDSGDAFYCEDCRSQSPSVYHACTIRVTAPFSSQATHGFCRECAQEALAVAGMHRKAKAC